MAHPVRIVSVLVALEFVAMSAIILLLVPLEKAVWLIPIATVFLIALTLSRF